MRKRCRALVCLLLASAASFLFLYVKTRHITDSAGPHHPAVGPRRFIRSQLEELQPQPEPARAAHLQQPNRSNNSIENFKVVMFTSLLPADNGSDTVRCHLTVNIAVVTAIFWIYVDVELIQLYTIPLLNTIAHA